MTRNKRFFVTLTAAFLLVVCSLIIGLTPIPFVSWQPGQTIDVFGSDNNGRLVQVEGIKTYDTTGELIVPTVSVTSSQTFLSLPQAVISYFKKDSSVLPRDYVYPLEPSKSGKDTKNRLEDERNKQMSDSQDAALVAALSLAGQPVQQTVKVKRVSSSGPAADKLNAGDTVRSLNGIEVKTKTDSQAIIKGLRPGDELEIALTRQGEALTVKISTVAGNENPQAARIGAEFEDSYQHPASAKYRINKDVTGPSAGLLFALGIYDSITPEDIIAGRSISGTGKISPSGDVRAVGGIRQKIFAAESAGAEYFLVPAGNCADIDTETSMKLIKVSKLDDAVSSLKLLEDPNNLEKVPTC
ncbi:YlbL family protein [Propionimicrobium lymphophilum]|uniref:YlbL family protein n=1 Tax=Propionimicrobium lymphophilum TaxID=33012 RepID=UPI003EC81C87